MSNFVKRLDNMAHEKRMYLLQALPTHLLDTGQVEQAYQLLINLNFIEAKCAAGMTYELLNDYRTTLASTAKERTVSEQVQVREFNRFVQAQAHILADKPSLAFQQAANEPEDTAPFRAAQRHLEAGDEIRPWLRLISKSPTGSACLLTFSGHNAAPYSCTLSADGQSAVSGDSDGVLIWWDVNSGAPLATTHAHNGAVTACAFSPDGRRLVSASVDKTLKLWDAKKALWLSTLTGHKDPIKACAFSPDGKRLFSCTEDCVEVWNAETGVEIAPLVVNNGGLKYSLLNMPETAGLVTHESSLDTVALSPNGRWAATASCWVGTVKIWDLTTGAERRTLGGKSDQREWHGRAISTCVFSPDGSMLATAESSTVKLWDITTGVVQLTLEGHKDSVSACAFAPDGRRIVSASRDGTLKFWDLTTGFLLGTMSGHLDNVTNVAFSIDRAQVLSASEDRTLKLWDVSAVLSSNFNERERLWVKARSWDGRILANGDGDPKPVLLDHETAQEGRHLQGQLVGDYSASFSPDGAYLITADGRSLRLWNVATGEEAGTFVGTLAERSWCKFSPDGTRVLTGTKQRSYTYEYQGTELKLWNVPALQELATLVAPYQAEPYTHLHFASFTPNGAFIVATVPGDSAVKVWDAMTGQEISVMHVRGARIGSCIISPNGSKILTFVILNYNRRPLTRAQRRMKLWDVVTGNELVDWLAHNDNDGKSCFSPDGTKIVTWGLDGPAYWTFKLWDVETGKMLAILGNLGHSVDRIFFSPDNKRIALYGDGILGSEKQIIHLWDAHGDGEIATLLGKPFGFSPDSRRFLTTHEGILIVWDVDTGTELIRYVSKWGVQSASWSRDGHVVIAHLPTQTKWSFPGETLADRIHLLHLENIDLGPVIVTAWKASARNLGEVSDTAFDCPLCHSWQSIDETLLGKQSTCSSCGEAITLNPFVLEANWHPIA